MDRIFQTAASSVVSIIILFVLTRLMGKKQMAQLNFFDYVIGISIGSIAAQYALVSDVSIEEGITAMLVMSSFSIAISYISVKSYKGRKILDGTPSILIENGKIINKNLQKAKLNINDLLEECRQKNIFDISEIEFAILESSGRLSIQVKSQDRPLKPRDIKIPTTYEGLCANIIIDGKIIENHLAAINQDKNWLNKELSKQNIKNQNQILLAYLDTKGTLHIHKKNNNKPKVDFIE